MRTMRHRLLVQASASMLCCIWRGFFHFSSPSFFSFCLNMNKSKTKTKEAQTTDEFQIQSIAPGVRYLVHPDREKPEVISPMRYFWLKVTDSAVEQPEIQSSSCCHCLPSSSSVYFLSLSLCLSESQFCALQIEPEGEKKALERYKKYSSLAPSCGRC